MSLIKPELPAPDPVLDSGELKRRFLKGTLEYSDITRGYRKPEIARLSRQLESNAAAQRATAAVDAGDQTYGAEPMRVEWERFVRAKVASHRASGGTVESAREALPQWTAEFRNIKLGWGAASGALASPTAPASSWASQAGAALQ